MLQLRIPLPRFISAGEVLHGKGSLSALRMLDGVQVAVVGSRSVLIHHREQIERSINHMKLSVIEYSGGEPTFESVGRLAEEIRPSRPNWIVAIGGGSVLDAAKLAWVLYEQPETDFEFLSRPFALRGLRGCCRFVAVPTTAGTGTEVSSAAVLTDVRSRRKKVIVSHELLPDISILDPSLTLNVPKSALVAAGMDALSHSVESYVSRFANPFADVQAEKSISIILRALASTISDPENMEVRMEMMLAAMMAGWVQNLKVPGVGHALAHQLSQFGVSHGIACGGLLLPAISANMRDNLVKSRYQELAKILGLQDTNGLLDRVRELKASIDFPSRLRTASSGNIEMSSKNKEVIFEGAKSDICAHANPISLTDTILEDVLGEAW